MSLIKNIVDMDGKKAVIMYALILVFIGIFFCIGWKAGFAVRE